MKRNNVFIIYALALAIVFVLSGAFLVGTANVPETYWLASVKQSAEGDKDASFATLDLDRTYTVKNDDGKDETRHHAIKGVYVYVGNVYTSEEQNKVNITFELKTPSSKDSQSWKTIKAEVTEFYTWQKVHDGNYTGYDRVEIRTTDAFELCEVAFTAEDGTLIKIENLVSSSANTLSSAAHLFDEQGSFNPSSAYAYKLSDEEIKELEAADGLFTDGKTVGKAPLSTVLNALAVTAFGRSPFAIRFFSLLSGFFALIALYLLIRRLFANDIYALFGSLFALFACALFSGAVTASTATALPFIFLAYYSAFGFFAERYKFSDQSASVKNIISCGLFVSLAVSFGASNILALIGIPVIWGIGIHKHEKEYKLAYESAKGLDKETVYMRHYKDVAACAWSMPVAFLFMPIVALMLSYAITYSEIISVYGGFLSGALKDIGGSFAIERKISALGLLIGYGSENAGSGYKLINYLPCALALAGFIFATVCLAASGNGKFKNAWRGIKNKYTLTAVTSACAYLPLLIGINLSVGGSAGFLSAFSIFILIGLSATEKFFNKKTFYVAIALLSLAFITFIGCCFGVLGAEISETAVKILYGWQR